MSLWGRARDQWRELRNRLLASPRFQKFAIDMPPFRPIAQRRARALFDLLAGFAYSQILHTTVKLGLIEMLQSRPLSASDVAARIGWPQARCDRLIKAAVSLDILERTSSGLVTLGRHGAALAGNPWIARFVLHHDLLYSDLEDPIELLSGAKNDCKLKDFWSYGDQHNAAAYTALMAASQAAVAEVVLDSHDFSRHRHLIDVGGSNGTFLAAAAARYPQLKLSLFDLPAVAELARAMLGNRVELHGGSFLTDDLPAGPDVATLIRIAHDHDDPALARILAAIRRMLPAGGRLILAEPLSGLALTAPITDAYFEVYFAAMGQGRTRTPEELAAMALNAGFSLRNIAKTRNPVVASVLEFEAT
jgi:demethylspheroidene O-methyltransferase